MGFNTYPSNPWPMSTEKSGSGDYDLPIASADTVGGVKVGNGLEINAETGVLSNTNPTPYSLPTAGEETLGGVKVGAGLSMNAETGALSADSQIADYSTTEHATGEKWIDGKDIYQKTIDFGALPNNTSKNVDSEITGVDTVVKIEGVANAVGGAIPLPFVDDSNKTADVLLDFSKTTGLVRMITGSDKSAFYGYVTIFYTKTT